MEMSKRVRNQIKKFTKSEAELKRLNTYRRGTYKKQIKEILRGSRHECMYGSLSGREYYTKCGAKIDSFLTVIFGCFKYGFPIHLPIKTDGLAFYPLIVLNDKLSKKTYQRVITHERIHIRQQMDIHLLFTLPLFIILCLAEFFGDFSEYWVYPLLLLIPQVFYLISMIPALIQCKMKGEKVTWTSVRENTCFEREANAHCMNDNYPKTRRLLEFIDWL